MTSKKKMQAIAALIHGKYDETFHLIYGSEKGYSYLIKDSFQRGGYLTLHVAVSKDNLMPVRDEFKAFVKTEKTLGLHHVSGFNVAFELKVSNLGNNISKYGLALETVTQFLSENNFVNVDGIDGKPGATKLYQVGSSLYLTTEENYAKLVTEYQEKNSPVLVGQEKVGLGVFGAFVGSLIGVLAIVLISKLGFISVLGGIILGLCTVKGYELMAKNFGKIGVVTSIILIILMVYLANRTTFAILVTEYAHANNIYEASFFDYFASMSTLVKEGYVVSGTYYGNLFKHYIFAGLGAVPTIIGAYKEAKLKKTTNRLD